MREKPDLISNIPKAYICGIYALEDSKGKVYIGSSKDVRSRCLAHRSYMNVCKDTGHSGFLNEDIEKAVLSGERFSCKVLATFDCEMSSDELREIERIFIQKFGGLDNTYNKAKITHRV